jgi:hypothetical protein
MAKDMTLAELKIAADNFCTRIRLPHLPAEAILRSHFKRKEYVEMVGLLRKALHIRVQMTVGIVRAVKDPVLEQKVLNAPAWVCRPDTLAPYGMRGHDTSRYILYIRQTFIDYAPFESFMATVGHELTHIVLDSIYHEHRDKERFVDVASMCLGFSNYVRIGHLYDSTPLPQWLPRVCAPLYKKLTNRSRTSHLGYLTPVECMQLCAHVDALRT